MALPLWLTLAEKHLQARGVNWGHAERFCFNEWSNPDDDELGVQIVKDLHRTGCSLFCGAEAEHNQALLKRVLLAYARWNKAVGYCQGFNMLAALILQVMDRSETDAVKVMIYLIEGVLPESYFANNLRGLSVDMAVFRDLLRLRLPALSRHLEQLQHDARDSATGTSYEPPLTNVFTMQWFLTLFSNCLPHPTVLRVWDLIFLEGNEVLLRTALAIWDGLADRILAVDSADEFYSIMGVLTREMLEFGLMDTNNLVKTIVTIAPFPFPELSELRDKYLYNITPWTQTVSTAAKRGLRLFYSDDDDETDEDDEKIAVATAYGISTVFRSPRRKDSINRTPSPSTSLSALNYSTIPPDRDRLALDISALKQQYAKLRERQRQAHIILTAACARQPLGPSAPTPVAMNHLLLGKSALLSVRGRRVGPPAGAVPPPTNITLRATSKSHKTKQLLVTPQGQLIIPTSELVMPQSQAVTNKPGETLHWKDAAAKRRSRRSSEDTSKEVSPSSGGMANGSTDLPSFAVPVIIEPELGDEETPSDRADADSDSSSTSTELCDEPDRLSDIDSEELTSISDASSYAPDITRLSSHSANKSPASSESVPPFPITTVSEGSPDESTESSELKINTQKDFSRSVSLDKSFDSITEYQDVPIQSSNKSPKENSDFFIPVTNIVKIPTSISSSSDSSEIVLSSTSRRYKEFSPTEQESILNSLNQSSPVSPIQKSVKNEFDQENCKAHFHASDSDTDLSGISNLTHDKFEKEPVKDILKLNTSLSFKQTSPSCKGELDNSITFSLLHPHVPNDNTIKSVESEEHSSSKLLECDKLSIKEEEKIPSLGLIDCKEILAAKEGIMRSFTDGDDLPSEFQDINRPPYSDDLLTDKSKQMEVKVKSKSSQNIAEMDLSPSQTGESLEHRDESDSPEKVTHDSHQSESVERSEDETVTDSMHLIDSFSKNDNPEEQTNKERSIDDIDMSVLLEINHRLHCQEKGLQSSLDGLTADLEESPDKGRSDKDIIDYAKMSELLEIDHRMNLGRRNSERALKIIQENSEILQRILQCQARRPSKLSEEESNGTNMASEDDSNDAISSVPTSSSLENVEIVPSALIKSSFDDGLSSKDVDAEINDFSLNDKYKSQPDALVATWKQGKSDLNLPKYNKEVKLSAPSPSISPITENTKKVTSYDKLFSSLTNEVSIDSTDFPPNICTSGQNEVSFDTKPKCFISPELYTAATKSSPKNDSPDILDNCKPHLRSLLLSPEIHCIGVKISSHDLDAVGISKSTFKAKPLDDPYPSSYDSRIHSSRNILDNSIHDSTVKHSKFSSHTTTDPHHPLSSGIRFGIKAERMPSCDTETISIASSSSEQIKMLTRSLYMSEGETKLTPELFYIAEKTETENHDKHDFGISKSSEVSILHDENENSDRIGQSSKPSSTCSSPLYQMTKSKLMESFFKMDSLSTYESSICSTSPNYSDIPKTDSPPTNVSTFGKETIDYFHLDSSTLLSSPSKSEDLIWTQSLRHTHPSSSKRRKESDEHFRRRPSSSSPRRRTSEDFPFDLRPFLTSSVSDSRTDLVHTKLGRESRPPSPTVSDCFTNMLNRSSSSSSLHGYHTKTKKELTSPPPSPFQRYTPPLRRSMSRERPMSLHFDIGSSFDTSKESLNQSRTSSPLYKSFSMLSVNETALPFENSSPYEKLDKSHSRRRTSTDFSLTLPRTKGKLSRINSPTYSPTKSKEVYFPLPPIKPSPTKSPMKFNPFPPRASMRQPKELGVKLGLYSITGDGTKGKITEKST